MADYYLIRHGEADYSELMEHRFYGFGRDLAPLTDKGIAQAEETAKDARNQYTTSEEAFRLTYEFNEYKGTYPAGKKMRWETVEDMRIRMRRVADKYADHGKVIFIGHGMDFRALAYIEEMRPAQIVEFHYEIGQADREYSFH